MLRSILAQLEFSHLIRKFDDEGTPFRTHLYVPECHPCAGTTFYEREDEAHVLKVTFVMFLGLVMNMVSITPN